MGLSNEKATPLLALGLAALVGYIAYTGALLEAKFQIRTFVKSPTSEGEANGS